MTVGSLAVGSWPPVSRKLGLTATPERHDDLDILAYFDNHIAAEIRLPDAINRKLLSPFQYFGITDCVDFSTLRWQRGGYLLEDLDNVLTGNDVRAALVIERIRALLLDVRQARGLGFCVSPSFSTGGVSDPGRGSKWTSCLKGLHYKSDLSVLV